MPTITRLAERRRPGDRRLAPGPPQGRPGPGLLARPGRRAPRRTPRRRRRLRDRHRRRRPPAPPSPASPTARSRVLENLRFNAGETTKDDAERGAFADQLAALADVYVGDGFGAVHRKHASVYDLPARLPHAAGDLIATEVGVLKKLTEDVKRPYAVVLGGAKVSDKLGVIDHLLEQGRPHPDRRRHGLHLPQGPGPRGRQLACSRRTRSRPSRSTWSAPRRRASSSCSRSTSWSPPAFPDLKTKAPADPDHRRRGRDPGRPDGPGHRPGDPQAVRLEARRRRHRLLERPDGRLRAPRLRRGHQGGRPGARRLPGLHASSAAATPPPPSASWASTRTHSATSRPVAAPASNTSRARRSPASPHWRTDPR